MKLAKEVINDIKRFAKRNFWDINQCKDFVQYASEILMKGRRAKLKYLYVDFLRSTFADKRRANFEEKNSFNRCLLSYDLYCRKLGADPIDNRVAEFLENNYEKFNKVERAFFILILQWGFNLKEVSQVLGVSDHRLSQIQTEIMNNFSKGRYII